MSNWTVHTSGAQWLMDADDRVVGFKDRRGVNWLFPTIQADDGQVEALTRPISSLSPLPPSGTLTISGTPLTTGTAGTAYSFSVTASGGAAPRTFSVASGSLPAGLTLNASSGVVSGTPTAAGTSSGVVIRVTDAIGGTASLAAFSVTIAASGAPDTRPRAVVGAGTATAAALFAAATPITNGTNGSRAVGTVGNPSSGFTSANGGAGQFGSVFILTSACVNLGGGVYGATFTDSVGPGGWSGTPPANATPTTTNNGLSESQSRTNVTVTDSSGTYAQFRMDYAATFAGTIS